MWNVSVVNNVSGKILIEDNIVKIVSLNLLNKNNKKIETT